MNWRKLVLSGVVVVGAVLVVVTAAPAQTQGFGASGGSGPSMESDHYMDSSGDGWTIGSEGDSIQVTFDPDAGPWIKTLVGPDGGGFYADDTGQFWPQSYTLTEWILIGPGPDWTDFHEEILTPGWAMSAIMTVNGLPPAGGAEVITFPDWPNSGGAIDWYFDPLGPGTVVKFDKTLSWEGDPDVNGNLFFGTITMIQYPTIPEPGTIVLLASGLLMVLGYAWRRRGAA